VTRVAIIVTYLAAVLGWLFWLWKGDSVGVPREVQWFRSLTDASVV